MSGNDNKRMWMVVEDDPSIRLLLSAMMSIWGIEELFFSNGHEAMAWLNQVEAGQEDHLPELALLDIRMPGPQGHEIAQRMRSLAPTKGMVIVMMTAFRFDPIEHEEIWQMAQPNLFVDKPLPEPSVFKNQLDMLVTQSQQL